MTTMNAAELEAEFTRLTEFATTDDRRRKCIALVRLEELQGRAMDLSGAEPLIERIVSLRRSIKAALTIAVR